MIIKYKNTPQWAIDLCEEINPDLPMLKWRNGQTGVMSSGCARYVRKTGEYVYIVITAGSNKIDQKSTLLHELAHTLAPLSDGHSERFWEIAWELYYKYMPEHIEHIKEREFEYKKMSELVYVRKGKK